MKRFEARVAVLKALEEKKLLRGKTNNPMVVPICRYVESLVMPSAHVVLLNVYSTKVRSNTNLHNI